MAPNDFFNGLLGAPGRIVRAAAGVPGAAPEIKVPRNHRTRPQMSTPSFGRTAVVGIAIGRRAENAKARPGVLSTLNPQNRRGRVTTGLLLAFLAFGGACVAVWISLWNPSPAPHAPERSPAPGAAGSAAVPSAGEERPPLSRPGPERERQEDAPPPLDASGRHTDAQLGAGAAPPRQDPTRFEGQGTLRGRLLLPGEAHLEGPWLVKVGPSPWLVGSEMAETRTLERPPSERDFRFDHLPLAGYQITIETPGWTGLPANALLQRRANDVFVTVQMERNATVEGTLFRSNGVPAEGIPARLEALEGELAFETEVDIAGKFVFEGVPEGNWRLLLGPPAAPLLPAQNLDVRRGALVLPQAQLPPLTWFRLILMDPDGEPLSGVEISGSGNRGGVVRGSTDAYGVFVGRDLPPGRWTIRASMEGYRSRRHLFVTTLEEPYEETLVLSP